MKKLVCMLMLLGVTGSVFAVDIETLHLFTIDGYYNNAVNSSYYFHAQLDGTGVSSTDIQLSSANYDDYLYDLTQETPNMWRYESDEYETRAAMLADHPASAWNFWWMPTDDEQDVAFNATKPGGIASFTSLSNSLNPVFEWAFNPNHGDALTAAIFDVEADEEIYTEQWTNINTAPTSWTPGILEAGKTYELLVGLWDVDISGGFIFPSDTFATLSSYGNMNVNIFTTVPEPATVALLGLGAMLFTRRKK